MKPASSRGATSSRKRKQGIEEIAFDQSARHDFLTGFHKSVYYLYSLFSAGCVGLTYLRVIGKLQRIKLAQEEALKREKEEKIVERKKVFHPGIPLPPPPHLVHPCQKRSHENNC